MENNNQSFVMVTYQFGQPIFIAPCGLNGIAITDKKDDAEKWGALDAQSCKLDYFKLVLGYDKLVFEAL